MDDVDDAVDWVVNLRADATLGGFHLDVDRSLGFSLQNILSDGKQKSSYFVFLRWSYFPIVSKKKYLKVELLSAKPPAEVSPPYVELLHDITPLSYRYLLPDCKQPHSTMSTVTRTLRNLWRRGIKVSSLPLSIPQPIRARNA
jgi:hypothetical protein